MDTFLKLHSGNEKHLYLIIYGIMLTLVKYNDVHTTQSKDNVLHFYVETYDILFISNYSSIDTYMHKHFPR